MNNRVLKENERIIKFRSWKNGKMEYSHRMPDIGFWKNNDNIFDIELMQYIGKKDCRGRDIFEGDIIKYFNEHQCCTVVNDKSKKADVEILFTDAYGTKSFNRYNALIGIVSWNNKEQVYEPIIIDEEYGYQFSFTFICAPEYYQQEDGWAQSWYEVIGNIYETPHLKPSKKNKTK